MNLIKTIHDHTFQNIDSVVDASNLVTGLTQCPLGHSLCIPTTTTTKTLTAYNTQRTTDLTDNLSAKSHLHSLQKKSGSDGGSITCFRATWEGSPNLGECDLGHTNCVVGQELPITVYRITVSGLGSANASLFTSVNLIKMLHTHSVLASEVTITRETIVRWLENCPVGHEDCIFDPVNAVTAWSMANVTTSYEGG